MYEKENLRKAFVQAKLDLSILGIGVSITDSSPITDIEVAIERMLTIVQKMDKKILIAIDEVENNKNMREFVSAFQIYIRQEYPLFLLMTGLYDNIDALQNAHNVTFLYRAPKIKMNPLDIGAIVQSYKNVFDIDQNAAKKSASITMGYPFAYHVLGYLCFANHCASHPEKILPEFDQRLSEYVYEKIWSELSAKDKQVAIAMTKSQKVSDIMTLSAMNKSEFSPYRSRLIKRGLAYAPQWGQLPFLLPRFTEFIEVHTF